MNPARSIHGCGRFEPAPMNRRDALRRMTAGLGLIGLNALLADEARAEAGSLLLPRPPHFPARAKRLIFLFMSGGVSHIETFDPKPALAKWSGQPLPFGNPQLQRTKPGTLMPAFWNFARHGQSGIEVSELFPKIAEQVDDLCIVRSLVADNINHTGAQYQMFTGEQTFSRPSLGSWLLYGLGSENRDLPGYVVISPAPAAPAQGTPTYSASFLPPELQGMRVADLDSAIPHLANPRYSPELQRAQLDYLGRVNETHRTDRIEDTRLNARIESFELAFRMQRAAAEVFDLRGESPATKKLYGLDDPKTETFGKQCLMARRLMEAGVRVASVYHVKNEFTESHNLWDQHSGLRRDHAANARATDQPIAGLLQDLKGRGLLDDTLVLWGGEFGRTPTAENADGREHHPFGFTMWLAGGGVKRGHVHGETDEFGWHAVKDKVHVHDLHATILHLMGLDHERLTYQHGGRNYRLTDVSGEVVKGIIA